MSNFSEHCFPIDKKTTARCLKDVILRLAKHLTKTSCRCPKCLKRKSKRFLRKTSWRHLRKMCRRCLVEDVWKMSYLINLKDILKNLKMTYRCLTGDDLQMSYQKLSCRCLKEDGLQMSHKICLADVFKTFYLVYHKIYLTIKLVSILSNHPCNECALSD